jgi:probable F420-dependent oxidoreductase
MKYIAQFPWIGPLATPKNAIRIAKAAEDFGYSEISIGEHIAYPKHRETLHPYHGALRFRDDDINLEPFTTLSFVAGHTSTLLLRTAIIVLAYHSPFDVAKQAANVDYLSSGRLLLGVGAGWMKEEFDLLKVTFEKRGSITDEYIRIINAVWRGEDLKEGKIYPFQDLYFPGRTAQKYPPLVIGGSTAPALRRVARFGDIWQPLDITAAQAPGKMAEINQLLAEAGRKPGDVRLNGVVFHDWGAGGDFNADHASAPDPDPVRRDADLWAESGADTCMAVSHHSPYYVSSDEAVRRLEWFAKNVMHRRSMM